MANWYRVTKRINGRLYDYWQRTHREGKSVKTENRYIGPVSRPALGPSIYSLTAPLTSDDVLSKCFSPQTTPEPQRGNIRKLMAKKRAILRNEEYFDFNAFEKVLDQLDYAHAVKTNRERMRDVKRKTRGIKAANPFLAQAIKKP